MSGHDGVAPSHEAVAVPDTAGSEQSMVAGYTESMVPASARRLNFDAASTAAVGSVGGHGGS
jgi:hypothetical protein